MDLLATAVIKNMTKNQPTIDAFMDRRWSSEYHFLSKLYNKLLHKPAYDVVNFRGRGCVEGACIRWERSRNLPTTWKGELLRVKSLLKIIFIILIGLIESPQLTGRRDSRDQVAPNILIHPRTTGQNKMSDDDYSEDDYSEDYSDEEDENGRARSPPSLASAATATTDELPDFGDSRYQSSRQSSRQSSTQGDPTPRPEFSNNIVHHGIRSRPSSRQAPLPALNDRPLESLTHNNNKGDHSHTYGNDYDYDNRQQQQKKKQKQQQQQQQGQHNTPAFPPRVQEQQMQHSYNYENDDPSGDDEYSDYSDDPIENESEDDHQRSMSASSMSLPNLTGTSNGLQPQSSTSQHQAVNSHHQSSMPNLPIMKGATTSSPTTSPMTTSSPTDHPIIYSPVDHRKEEKKYAQFTDKQRPWVQRRAAHVHRKPSVFGSSGRPQLPHAILSVGDHPPSWKVAETQRRQRRQRNQLYQPNNSEWSTLSSYGSGMLPSPERVVPGGNHLSFLATADRKWAMANEHFNSSVRSIDGGGGGGDGGGGGASSSVNATDCNELSQWLFERLLAIMKVYKLRSKDIFASLDRNADGIIGSLDMFESLQVLGVVDLLPREATRLVRYIARQSGSRGLDFHALEFALRRSNTGRERSLNHRMGHFVGSQNALSSKIQASQEVTAQLVALVGTELDATRAIADYNGKMFWQQCFSTHTPVVSLKRFISELKTYMNRRRRPGLDDEWIYRRIHSFVATGSGKVSSSSFGQMLSIYGPFTKLFKNVLAGPLMSNQMKKKIRHKKIQQEESKKRKKGVRFTRGKTRYL